MRSRQTTLLYDDFSGSIPDTYRVNSQWYTPNGYVNVGISGGVISMKMKAQGWLNPSQSELTKGNVFGWQRGRDLALYARFKLTITAGGTLNQHDCWVGFSAATAFSTTYFGLYSSWGTGTAFTARSYISGTQQQSTAFSTGADNSWHEVWITCPGSSSNVIVKLDAESPVTLTSGNLTGSNLTPGFKFSSNDGVNERGIELDKWQVSQNRNWSHS